MTNHRNGEGQRRFVNIILRALVDPFVDWLYWRLDLWDHKAPPGEKRSSHSKVLATFAFFLGCAGLTGVGYWLFVIDVAPLDHAQLAELLSAAAAGGLKSDEIGPLLAAAGLRPSHGAELGMILGFAFLVFSMPFGLAGYKAAAASKVGAAAATAVGVAGAAQAQGQADLVTTGLQTSAAVAARRAQGGGDFEVTP